MATQNNHEQTQPSTRQLDQLLGLLDELNGKLSPLPAAKPETINPNDMHLQLPLLEAREGITAAIGALERACTTVLSESKALARKLPPARNERAWAIVFEQLHKDMLNTVEATVISANNVRSHARLLAQMLVLASDGTPIDGQEAGNE